MTQEQAQEIVRQTKEIAEELDITEEQAYQVWKERMKIAEGYGDFLIQQKYG